MISAQEARGTGPISDYVAVSRELQKQIWKAINARRTSVALSDVCKTVYTVFNDSPVWHPRLVEELKALGYEVSAEGIVSW